MTAKRVISGLTFITLGVILLANTTGALPWAVWWNILMLWPLLLIAAGIDVLGRSLDNGLVRALGSLLVLAGLVYGALAGTAGVPQLAAPFTIGGTPAPFTFAEQHDASVTTGRAHVAGGLGRLSVAAGEQLATAQGETPFGPPELSVRREGSRATVEVRASGEGGLRFGPSPRSVMDVTLDRFVLWETLKVDAGLSRTTLDLSRLHYRALEADLGMSSAEITLGRPWEGNEQVTVKAGMSTLVIRVPAGVASELDIENGLGTTTVGREFRRVGDGDRAVWRSAGAGGEPQLTVKVDAGMSTVRVESYLAPEAEAPGTEGRRPATPEILFTPPQY